MDATQTPAADAEPLQPGFLVLTRKQDQRIVIARDGGELLELVVVEVRAAGQVRLGIRAPQNYRILREELLHRGGAETRRKVVTDG